MRKAFGIHCLSEELAPLREATLLSPAHYQISKNAFSLSDTEGRGYMDFQAFALLHKPLPFATVFLAV